MTEVCMYWKAQALSIQSFANNTRFNVSPSGFSFETHMRPSRSQRSKTTTSPWPCPVHFTICQCWDYKRNNDRTQMVPPDPSTPDLKNPGLARTKPTQVIASGIESWTVESLLIKKHITASTSTSTCLVQHTPTMRIWQERKIMFPGDCSGKTIHVASYLHCVREDLGLTYNHKIMGVAK